jgi:hypothetical protein
MGTGSSPGVESGRGVTLTPHPLLVPRSKNSRAIPLLSLRAFVAYEKRETYQIGHRVIQGERSVFWEVIVSVIVRKKLSNSELLSK